jgi:hypothetical protein
MILDKILLEIGNNKLHRCKISKIPKNNDQTIYYPKWDSAEIKDNFY